MKMWGFFFKKEGKMLLKLLKYRVFSFFGVVLLKCMLHCSIKLHLTNRFKDKIIKNFKMAMQSIKPNVGLSMEPG